MATRSSARSPRVNRKLLHGITSEAVDTWFAKSGLLEKQRGIDRSRTFKFYGMSTPHLDKLSKHVIDAVKQQTGVGFKLTPVRFREFKASTIDKYINDSVVLLMAALPGEPVILPGEPVTLPGEPVTLPGEPAILPKEPKKKAPGLPGEPTTLPSFKRR